MPKILYGRPILSAAVTVAPLSLFRLHLIEAEDEGPNFMISFIEIEALIITADELIVLGLNN
jgi:hypothetical protein